MNYIGTVQNYNKITKKSMVLLTVSHTSPIILKNIPDGRSTVGGGVTIEQPLSVGDIVIVSSICAHQELKLLKQVSYEQSKSSNDYIITGVIETKKNPLSLFEYEDTNNKISLDGIGKGKIKIGQFDFFKDLTSMLSISQEILNILKTITATTVTPGGNAVGEADLAVVKGRLAPIEANIKKIEIVIKSAEKI